MVLREVGLALVAAGVVVLAFIAYDLFGTTIAEQQGQAKLARQFSSALARPALAQSAGQSTGQATGQATGQPAGQPAGTLRGKHPGARRQVQEVSLPVVPLGGALDHLVIPAIGVNRYVVQGVAEQDLQMGPGHYPGTPLPGQAGNVGIAGHRTTYGAPFFLLNRLGKGDLIYITDLSGTTWVYSVARQWVVSPSDVGVLDPTRGAKLTLTTCNPRFWATTRLVVRADLVEHLAPGVRLQGRLPVNLAEARGFRGATGYPAPTTASHAGALSPGSTLAPTTGRGATAKRATAKRGGGSPAVASSSLVLGGAGAGTWAMAIGFGALAVAIWVAARLLAYRRRRYAKAALLVAGAVVCLVPLWFAFGAVVNLLPANF